MRKNTLRGSPTLLNTIHGFFFLGGPIDLMARRVLAAGSQEIAEKASKHLECIDLPRD